MTFETEREIQIHVANHMIGKSPQLFPLPVWVRVFTCVCACLAVCPSLLLLPTLICCRSLPRHNLSLPAHRCETDRWNEQLYFWKCRHRSQQLFHCLTLDYAAEASAAGLIALLTLHRAAETGTAGLAPSVKANKQLGSLSFPFI